MIKQLNYITYTLLLTIATFSLPAPLLAEEATSQVSPLFKFQQKLALKGNARAQYKLACMYEAGSGVALDLEQAKLWYDKAAKKGMKAASNRSTYLLVKEKGYDQATHTDWLKGVRTDAKARNVDALFLLGQLYREGLGVKKDLNKALSLFEQVSLSGDADIEDEIAMIQVEIAENDKARIAANKQRQAEAARLAAVKQAQQQKRLQQRAQENNPKVNAVVPVAVAIISPAGSKKATTSKTVTAENQKIQQQAEAERIKQEEKVLRYKKAMMQLKLEQQKIDEQQAWASGGTSSTADDEI